MLFRKRVVRIKFDVYVFIFTELNFCIINKHYINTFIHILNGICSAIGDKEVNIKKHIVLGYKIDDKNYLALHFLITVVEFFIY